MLQGPLTKGESWISGEMSIEIIRAGGAMTVPAGKFNDIVGVTASMTGAEEIASLTFYLAPGIGIIRAETMVFGATITQDLLEYGGP
jgi:hypothetical protein